MTDAGALATLWIESWSKGDPSPIPLAEGFVHISPFGRIEGREAYLEFMAPMTGDHAMPLTVLRLLAGDDEAVIHYRMPGPGGPVDACDWVAVNDGEIIEIRAFYDATSLRG